MQTEGILRGNRWASPHVWLETAGQSHLEVIWPLGCSARFDPRLELLDGSGAVVGRDGDQLRIGGGGDPWEACGPPEVLRRAAE